MTLRSVRIAQGTVAAGMVILATVACSPTSRYRVLSFVFDGVPPPDGVEAPIEYLEPQEAEDLSPFVAGLRQLRAQTPKHEKKPMILSVHQPVADRKCGECHNPQEEVGAVPTDATLCDKCHADERTEGGWNHGPVNLGTCIPCHVPHRSPNEHLLSAPVPGLCLDCHVSVRKDNAAYHAVDNFAECVACHDPHRMY